MKGGKPSHSLLLKPGETTRRDDVDQRRGRGRGRGEDEESSHWDDRNHALTPLGRSLEL